MFRDPSHWSHWSPVCTVHSLVLGRTSLKGLGGPAESCNWTCTHRCLPISTDWLRFSLFSTTHAETGMLSEVLIPYCQLQPELLRESVCVLTLDVLSPLLWWKQRKLNPHWAHMSPTCINLLWLGKQVFASDMHALFLQTVFDIKLHVFIFLIDSKHRRENFCLPRLQRCPLLCCGLKYCPIHSVKCSVAARTCLIAFNFPNWANRNNSEWPCPQTRRYTRERSHAQTHKLLVLWLRFVVYYFLSGASLYFLF